MTYWACGALMNNLWRITKLAAQDKWRWIGAWTALLLSTAFFLAVPRLIGLAIDGAFPEEGKAVATSQELITFGVLIIAVIALRGLFNFSNMTILLVP